MVEQIENLSGMLLQKDTSFNSSEKFLIEPSLQRMLDDMDLEAAERYSKILNPIALIFGLGLWYVRIMPVNPVKNNRNNHDNVSETMASEQPTQNQGYGDIYNPFAQVVTELGY